MSNRPLHFQRIAFTALVVCGSVVMRAAHADGKPASANVTNPTTRQYNDRLPPILPGEEIVTETGQKMRVWSSSGPVPVNPQPTPQQLPSGVGGVGGVGVIIDGRADHKNQGVHHVPSHADMDD